MPSMNKTTSNFQGDYNSAYAVMETFSYSNIFNLHEQYTLCVLHREFVYMQIQGWEWNTIAGPDPDICPAQVAHDVPCFSLANPISCLP